jgi:3-oxo-5-alpha-steroid 4-dehydrogenase 1
VLNAFLLSLFVLHYVNRAIIYPLRAKLVKPMPVSMFAMSAAWTAFNGTMHGVWLGWYATFDANWSVDPRFIAGLALFFAGFYINCESDEILRNLRGPRQTGYYIPRGSLFDWVSAPNYFGETVEWTGFALAMGGAWVSVAFAVFTFANLFPRALSTHKWYKNKFGAQYPAERKAFFPFIF